VFLAASTPISARRIAKELRGLAHIA